MKFAKEESFLIDYLKSFELIDAQDDLRENNSVLDRVMDSNYKKKIELYVETIGYDFHNSITRYFIGEKFNILFSIVSYHNVSSFSKLKDILEKYTLEDLFEVFSAVFHTQSGFSFSTIGSLLLSFEDKWKLAFIINEFYKIKKKLLQELSLYYDKYVGYAEDLYQQYLDKIKHIESVLAEKETLYQNVFQEYLDKKIYDEIDKRLILLISANEIIIYSTKKYNLLAMGLYVFDFYLELEQQKKVDEVKLIQIFKSLSDPTRYGIIKSINKGVTSNSVLADMFSVSRAAISMQFKYLQANDIITVDETTKQYVVNKDVIRHAIELIQLDMDLLDK